MSPSDRTVDNLTGAERRVLRECKLEAFWQRSLPLTIICGSWVFMAARMKKIKPNGKLGATAIVAAGIGYWGGKLQYILSGSCLRKFIEQEPDGLVAYTIRNWRGVSQPDSITPEIAKQYEIAIEDDEEDVLDIEGLPMDSKAESILSTCEETAVFGWGLPGALSFSAVAVQAQRHGYLKDFSKLVRYPWSRVPWVGFAFVMGNHVGQHMYANFSNDCYNRFLSEQPKGLPAREIKAYFALKSDATSMTDVVEPPVKEKVSAAVPTPQSKTTTLDGDHELSPEGYFLPVRARVRHVMLGKEELILQSERLESKSWTEDWMKGKVSVKGGKEVHQILNYEL